MKVYIDGSSKKFGDKWYGGYGVYIPEMNFKFGRGCCGCTNQKAELTACLKALKTIKFDGTKYEIYSDSMYCINIVMDWMYKWKKNGWKKGDGEISNIDVIKKIYNILNKHKDDVIFYHIKSHTKKPNEKVEEWEGNMVVDEIANQAMKKISSRCYKSI